MNWVAWHDLGMLSHLCAFCGSVTHFTARFGWIESIERAATGRSECRVAFAATCDNCEKFNIATGDVSSSNYVENSSVPVLGSLVQGWSENMENITWSPPAMVQADTEFLPDNVGAFLQEAHDTFSVGAYRGTLLLVRSVVEATAKDKGIETGSLVQKVNNLHADGHIRTGTKEMAHTLRILGNDMAHGDIREAPTEEDARDALVIARFVLDDVYVADARRADMLARRSKTDG